MTLTKTLFTTACLLLPMALMAGERPNDGPAAPRTPQTQGPTGANPAPAVPTEAQQADRRVRLEHAGSVQRQRGLDMGRCRQEATDRHLGGVEWRQAVAACVHPATN